MQETVVASLLVPESKTRRNPWIRLAFKTVDSQRMVDHSMDRLRSAFNDLGRERQDNPAAARVVKAYLKDVTNEQLMVGLVPEQRSYPGIILNKVR
jgi:hypothetical protein